MNKITTEFLLTWIFSHAYRPNT